MNLPAEPVKKKIPFQGWRMLKKNTNHHGLHRQEGINEKTLTSHSQTSFFSREIADDAAEHPELVQIPSEVTRSPPRALGFPGDLQHLLTYKCHSVIYFCLLILRWMMSEKPLAAINFCSRQPEPSRTGFDLELKNQWLDIVFHWIRNNIDAKMGNSIVQLGCVLHGIIAARLL